MCPKICDWFKLFLPKNVNQLSFLSLNFTKKNLCFVFFRFLDISRHEKLKSIKYFGAHPLLMSDISSYSSNKDFGPKTIFKKINIKMCPFQNVIYIYKEILPSILAYRLLPRLRYKQIVSDLHYWLPCI